MSPKLIIFSSGTKDGGGSGFENLVRSKNLDAEVVAVVSSHGHGGVREYAERLGVPFVYFAGPYDTEHYQKIVEDSKAEWVALSGWLKQIVGLDPTRTFNIHPALLSQLNGRFGGTGMYGSKLHEAVRDAFDAGEISESGFTMHFVTDEYDRGPVFFEYYIPLKKGITAEEIGRAVKKAEHKWQPKITNMVVHGEIRWDGRDQKSLIVPEGYQYLPKR